MAADNVKQLFVNPVGLTMTLQEFNMAAPIATTTSKYMYINQQQQNINQFKSRFFEI